jgi:hypothetical protein
MLCNAKSGLIIEQLEAFLDPSLTLINFQRNLIAQICIRVYKITCPVVCVEIYFFLLKLMTSFKNGFNGRVQIAWSLKYVTSMKIKI